MLLKEYFCNSDFENLSYSADDDSVSNIVLRDGGDFKCEIARAFQRDNSLIMDKFYLAYGSVFIKSQYVEIKNADIEEFFDSIFSARYQPNVCMFSACAVIMRDIDIRTKNNINIWICDLSFYSDMKKGEFIHNFNLGITGVEMAVIKPFISLAILKDIIEIESISACRNYNDVITDNVDIVTDDLADIIYSHTLKKPFPMSDNELIEQSITIKNKGALPHLFATYGVYISEFIDTVMRANLYIVNYDKAKEFFKAFLMNPESFSLSFNRDRLIMNVNGEAFDIVYNEKIKNTLWYKYIVKGFYNGKQR